MGVRERERRAETYATESERKREGKRVADGRMEVRG